MRVLAALFAIASLHASVIQGVVLDDETGAPLARTTVTLAPLPGQQLAPVSVRVTGNGTFAIVNVHSGWYVLRATHRGFLPSESGQKRAGRPGIPFAIDDSQDSSQFIQLRMFRLCAISGTVLDENGVGLPDISVNVYTAKQPVHRVGEATTDDRGHFRVDRLDPGVYVIHSAAAILDDDTPLLPTYHKTGTTLADAEPVTVRAAETFNDVVIRPVKGSLFRLSRNFKAPGGGQVRLTLITDSGRRVIASAPGQFSVDNLPPGQIELFAEGPGCGADEVLSLQQNLVWTVTCLPVYPPRFIWTVKGALPSQPVPQYPLMARRVDLAGEGPEFPVTSDHPFPPGRWEFRVVTGPQHYVVEISAAYPNPIRAGDWFQVTLAGGSYIRITLSASPATLQGTVTASGNPVPGAPVFLEWFDPELRDPSIRLFDARTDASGNYAFLGLAPGHYRVISSYDFDPTDPGAMEHAAVLDLKEGQTASQPLETALP